MKFSTNILILFQRLEHHLPALPSTLYLEDSVSLPAWCTAALNALIISFKTFGEAVFCKYKKEKIVIEHTIDNIIIASC